MPVASPAITLDDPGDLSVVLTAGLIDSVLDTDESATFQIIGTKTDAGGAMQVPSTIDNLVIVGTVVPESASLALVAAGITLAISPRRSV